MEYVRCGRHGARSWDRPGNKTQWRLSSPTASFTLIGVNKDGHNLNINGVHLGLNEYDGKRNLYLPNPVPYWPKVALPRVLLLPHK